MKWISLIVSAYSNQKAIRQANERMIQAGDIIGRDASKARELIQTAQKKYNFIRQKGVDYLRELFDDTGMWNERYVLPYVGMFDKGREPSTIMQIPFTNEQEWLLKAPIVKTRVAKFGKRFKQSVVHIADLHATKPRGTKYGESVIMDTRYQKKFHFEMKQLKNHFGNLWLLAESAKRAEITEFSAGYFGNDFLLYSIGGDDSASNETRQALTGRVSKLRASVNDLIFTKETLSPYRSRTLPDEWRNLLEGRRYDVALITYGRSEQDKIKWGASHTYDEVLEIYK